MNNILQRLWPKSIFFTDKLLKNGACITQRKSYVFSTKDILPHEGIVKEVKEAPLPSEADVVICGGGISGCSIAYHLALEGQKRVVLLEQGR